MDAMEGTLSFQFSQLSSIPPQLSWLNAPPTADLIGQSESSISSDLNLGLKVVPAANTDFWHRTYYDPPLDKANGHSLLMDVSWSRDQWAIETKFSLHPLNQFDQAGLMIFIDTTHWLKAGIEYVDGQPKMSCVVTNGQSDWSTQPWEEGLGGVAMRVSYIRDSYIVECKGHGSKCWEFIRIGHLSTVDKGQSSLRAGLYCCAPMASGMHSVFQTLSLSHTVSFDHHA